jgi:hypothetical protein
MTKPPLLTRKTASVVLALALAGAGAWYAMSDSGDAANLTELDPASFEQLKRDFNEAAGNVRVIVLLSPS